MKKTILTTIIALFCFSASAQFRVISNVNQPTEDESWSASSFTDNIGIGYQVNDKVMVGLQRNGENYDVVGRYNVKDNLYISAQMPQEDGTENITLGVGVSMKVLDNLYIEPNYTRKDEEGSFNIGLSYTL